MKEQAFLRCECPNGHEYETELVRWSYDPDTGYLTGTAGSAQDFCDVCGSSGVITYGARMTDGTNIYFDAEGPPKPYWVRIAKRFDTLVSMN